MWVKREMTTQSRVEGFAHEIQASWPQNIWSPTNMVGAPNTPRSTASCVTAFRRSFTSCEPANASRAVASKPAFWSTAPTVAGSFMFFGSTHIAWKMAST